MSSIGSNSEDLILNADGGSSTIKLKINGTEKASISSAGAFTSTTIDATKLTGALPAISGASLTNLPADSTKLPLAGGTLTGDLIISENDPNLRMVDTNTGSYSQLTNTNGSLKIEADLGAGSGSSTLEFTVDNSTKMTIMTQSLLNNSGVFKTGLSTATTSGGWNFDSSNATISCSQNTAIKIGDCGASGMVLINDTTLNGQMAGFFTGGGVFTFIGASGHWVNSSSPNTSQVGFYNSGSQIYVKNGKSATVQLGLMTFRTRSAQ